MDATFIEETFRLSPLHGESSEQERKHHVEEILKMINNEDEKWK